jgi:hypothetical protein
MIFFFLHAAGYKFTSVFNNSIAQSSVVVRAASWQMSQPNFIGFVAADTTNCVATLAITANAYNQALVSPSTATDLGNKELFPYFARISPDDGVQALALHQLILSQGWTEAQIIYSSDTYGNSLSSALQSTSRNAALAGMPSVTFTSLLSFNAADSDSMAQTLTAARSLPNRILIVICAAQTANILFAQVTLLGIANTHTIIGTDAVAINSPILLASSFPVTSSFIGSVNFVQHHQTRFVTKKYMLTNYFYA